MTCVIRVFSAEKGDEPFEYDTEVAEEVALAEQLFNQKVKVEGKMALAVEDGHGKSLMTDFDPHAREILISNRPVGG